MEISLAAETVTHIGSFPVTNTLIASVLTLALWAGIALSIKRRAVALVPHGLQNLVEFIIESLLKLIDGVTGDRSLSKRFFPIVATIFLFVVTSNWIGLLPGFGTIGVYEEIHGKTVLVPFFRSVNADLNFTLGLAIVSVIGTQVFGIAVLGFFKYWKKFFINPLRNPIMSAVGLLELFGEVAKMVSFSFRLFGNVFAGEVLLLVIASLLPFIAPLPFYFLELFVGFIQGFIFAVLTLVFLRVATATAEH